MASSNGVALAAELFVARLALEVVAEEIEQGWSFPGANRPLFQHEIKARTRFGDLEDSSQAALRAVRAVTDPLWGDLLDDVLRDLLEHSDSASDIARRLGDLRATQAGIPGIDSKVANAQAKIYQAVLQARHDWAQHTLREAIAQGVDPMTLPAANDLKPTPAQRAYLEQRAREVAQHPLNRIVDIASKSLGSRDLLEVDPLDAIAAIRTAVTDASHDGTDDIAKQAVTDSGNQGRASIAAEGPKPKHVYASELLDGSTCVPCSHLDGHVYASIEEAATDYPNGGGYVKCDGGRRCRGTLVYVWPDEADPTVGAPEIPDPVKSESIDVAPTPEPEFVDKLVTALHAGKLTPESLAAQAAKASPLGKANAVAATDRYNADLAAAAARESKRAAEAAQRIADRVPGDGTVPTSIIDALLPKRGGWTTSTRAKTVAALKESPEGRQLLKVVDSFQSGSSAAIPRLRTEVEAFLSGEHNLPAGRVESIETLLSAIRSTTFPDDTKALYRGMVIPGKLDDVLARYAEGSPLDLSISSFSSSKSLAQGFTEQGAGKKITTKVNTPVLIEWVGEGKKALPIQNLGKSNIFAEEKEWVAAGRYEVVSTRTVKRKGVDTVIVTIRQLGTW